MTILRVQTWVVCQKSRVQTPGLPATFSETGLSVCGGGGEMGYRRSLYFHGCWRISVRPHDHERDRRSMARQSDGIWPGSFRTLETATKWKRHDMAGPWPAIKLWNYRKKPAASQSESDGIGDGGNLHLSGMKNGQIVLRIASVSLCPPTASRNTVPTGGIGTDTGGLRINHDTEMGSMPRIPMSRSFQRGK